MSKGTTIRLDGEDRHLRYDMNAIAEIEEALDIKLRPAAMEEDIRALADRPLSIAKTARLVLWAGLRWEDKDLTIEEAGAWVDTDNIMEVMEGFFAQFPEMPSDLEESVRTTLGISEAEAVPEETVPTT